MIRKHTSTAATLEIIGGYCMPNGRLNVEYFAGQVSLICDNTDFMYKERFNTRRKSRNLAINEMLFFIDRELGFAGYTGYYATNKQCIDWDRAHGGDLEAALDIIEAEILRTREECK